MGFFTYTLTMVPVRLVGSAWILPLSSAALSVSRLVSRWQNNKFGMGWDGACGQVPSGNLT